VGNSQTFDVIVVGAGPGGSIVAKRCAESGLNTLLIEKKKLPRDKVCTGMVMGNWARDIITSEFGQIPQTVLVNPPHLSGHRIHVAGAEPQTLVWHTALAWRKDLDFWMVQGARDAGAIVRDGLPVVHVVSEEGACRVMVQKDGSTETLVARFVVGADGSTSAVRRSIYPELNVRYSTPIRECYLGGVQLEKNLIHWFFPRGQSRPRFNVNHKNDVFLIEGSGIRELRSEIGQTLEPYGFDLQSKPEWKDACAIALLHEQLISRKFVPAQGNILLIGDAAGLILPITFEGIGSALKSGLLAADCIVRGSKTGKHTAALYLKALEPILDAIRRLCTVQDDLSATCHAGPSAVAESLLAAYREAFIVQSPQL
jgi:flavin-dependent dehydrogenase